MKIAVCIDKSGGMLFNGRRVSQDSVLRQRLFSLLCPGEALYMNSFSAKQFETTDQIVCDDDFLNKAQDSDLCFVENCSVPFDKAEVLYIFNWNRQYPADTFFEFDPKALNFNKIGTEDFEGSSHKRITLTIYKRG